MRLSDAGRLGAAALVLLLAAAARAAPEAPGGELTAVRTECIAAAAAVQRDEGQIRALEHQVDLLGQDVAGRQRGLDESRPVQERLLGILERLSRNPPERRAATGERPLDRLRSRLLIEALAPALRAEAQALAGELTRLTALRTEAAAKQRALAAARATLAGDLAALAQATASRLESVQRLRPDDAAAEARAAGLAGNAKDVDDLIRRADAAAQHRERPVPAGARSVPADDIDPARPPGLRAFDPPQSTLTMPVSGNIASPFAASVAAWDSGRGIGLSALPGAVVVAPFDGRVVYAGPFRDLGLVLILRHGREYHSLLAGLGRVDVKLGQWLLAGEPVGRMPDASDGPLFFELRRDGRPVDPQPWLATRGEGSPREHPTELNERNGDQRVRQ